MGLVDKIKNIFTEEVTEEEEEEIKVEQIKKETRSVPIESPTERREKKVSRIEKRRIPADEELIEEEPVLEEEKTKSPVFFTDRDFEDLVAPKKTREKVKAEKTMEPPKKEEAPKPYGGSYSSTAIIKEKQNFKPTPIISPVYGVLDKNYHKEDIIDKKENTPRESVDGLSVDTIRNKAYGTLEDDLEDTMVKPTSKKIEENNAVEDVDLFDELEQSASHKEESVSPKTSKDVRKLEEITMDLTKELDNLLLKKEKDKKEKAAKEKEKEDAEVKVETVKSEKVDENLPESDLFNLIDSMYEEGEDE